MDIITSNANQYIKLVKGLSDKKNRTQSGLFMLEGERLIKDSKFEIEFLLVSEEKFKKYEYLTAGKKFFLVTESCLKSAADTVSPCGIIAVARIPKISFKLPSGNALLLDGVIDSGNLGTIIRTAASVGFSDVYLYNCSDCYSPKTVRASMSGILKVNIYEVNFDEMQTLLKSTESFALDMNGKSLFESIFKTNVTFVAGNEAHGVSSEVLSCCKGKISLPMENCMESLNVAVASGVAMYYTKLVNKI